MLLIVAYLICSFCHLGGGNQFAQEEEWSALCNLLASRLVTAGNMLAATLCFICAGNIDKTVEIWSRNLGSEHEGKSYVDLLQVVSHFFLMYLCLLELNNVLSGETLVRCGFLLSSLRT